MPARSKVLCNRTIRGEEALHVPSRLEPLHPSLSLAGRLMGVLCPVVQVAVLAMFHPREDLALRHAVALELIRDDHTRDICQPFEQLAEELLRRLLIPATLHENIQDIAVLTHRPPQIMAFLIDREKDFV